MSQRFIDVKGMKCPKPLITVKKTLMEMPVGESFQVVLDSETAWGNVFRFLSDNGCEPTKSSEKDCYFIIGKKPEEGLAAPRAEEYCASSAAAATPVICFNRQGMGQGAEELGGILIQGFVHALKEISPPPSAMVFYNAGVNLACEGSPILQSLKELEKRGVKLLVCGTCLEYYDLKTKLGTGTVSNMYDILQTLSGAHHVINP